MNQIKKISHSKIIKERMENIVLNEKNQKNSTLQKNHNENEKKDKKTESETKIESEADLELETEKENKEIKEISIQENQEIAPLLSLTPLKSSNSLELVTDQEESKIDSLLNPEKLSLPLNPFQSNDKILESSHQESKIVFNVKGGNQENRNNDSVNLESIKTVNEIPFTLSKPLSRSSSFLNEMSMNDSITTDRIDSLVAELPQIPAHVKFAHLNSSFPSCKPLFAIPSQFQILEKLLYALDTICTLSFGRGEESVIFQKVLKSIENIVGRSIKIEHVKKINFLLPGAYKLNERAIIWLGRRVQSWEISISSHLIRDDSSISISFKNDSKIDFNDSVATIESMGKSLSQKELVHRREQLHRSIIEYIKPFHQDFLRLNGIVIPDEVLLKSWHPKFNVESIPDMELKIIKRGEMEGNQKERESKREGDTIKSGNFIEKSDNSRRESSSSVLERIKEKEMKNDIIRMTGINDEYKKVQNQRDLLKFAEAILFLFSSMGKTSLPLREIYAKLSGRIIISIEEMEEKIAKLANKCSEWISIEMIGLSKFIRIKKSVSMMMIREKVQIIEIGKEGKRMEGGDNAEI